MRDTSLVLGKTESFLREIPARLLIVYEDAEELERYKRDLQVMGYAVTSAICLEDAAQIVRCRPFDLMMVSQGGPGFKSKQLLALALERDPQIPLIVLTRAVNVNCYIDAMELGAVDYVETPLSATELANLVSAHIQPYVLAA